jgi:L-aminopeptidase/D-esterase-like protein
MQRTRLRDLGITIGDLPTGPHNAITDVPGVLVGHFTNTPQMDSLFAAAVEAVEEAIWNALTSAETMSGRQGRTVHAIPLDQLQQIWQRSRR